MISRSPIIYSNRMTTALPPAIAAAVREAARRQGLPLADYIRRALAGQLLADGLVRPPAGRPVHNRSTL